MPRTAIALALTLAVLAATPRARAVSQPDGTVVPQGPEVQSLFASRSEPLNATLDAAIVPERFVPGCVLNFSLVTRGAALFRNSFGWYNVTGARPDESDLHVLIPCDAPPGFVATLDLRTEAAYRGGEIGFFLRTPQAGPSRDSGCTGGDCCGRAGHPGYTYYTERGFNPDNAGAASYIHLLIYDSRVTPRAFYFAWEDLYGGGDNQFTDFVALVSNIVCSGAGGACDTGRPGVCAAGTQQCRAGALQCVGEAMPSPERCDGLDNDCDGMIDEGDALCPVSQVCDRGTCLDRCVEFSCFAGEVCTARGTCAETACATLECPAGRTCRAGACVEPCDAVVCPRGQSCRAGRCADPCAGLACDADQVCESGVCRPRCECRRCAADEACGADGRCAPAACTGVRCAPGSSCVAGVCRDDCETAVCPRGETCTAGACVASAPDAGAGDAGGRDAGGRDATMGGPDAAGMDGSTDVVVDGGFTLPRRGCGCRTQETSGRGIALGWIAALAALGARRRRGRARG